MRRFLLLYTNETGHHRHYAEGVVLFDGAVFCRDFAPSNGQLWFTMLDFSNAMRDNDDIRSHQIIYLDEVSK